MGIEIAKELFNAGANVTLVCGPVNLNVPDTIKRIDVSTADQMLNECSKVFPDSDILVMSAAVSDYKPENIKQHKIKKSEDNLSINLVPNPDILSSLTSIKKNSQLVVGFALETDDAINNAFIKLEKKNLDFVVLNKPGKDSGFGSLTNKVSLIFKDKKIKNLPLKTKNEIAVDIVNEIALFINK